MSADGHNSIPAPRGATAMVLFTDGSLPAGTWLPAHDHPQHQLAWASRGVLTVRIGDGHWMLPPTRALWVPGGTVHRTGTSDGADMRGIYLEPDRMPPTLADASWADPTMVRVTPLLHNLFDHLSSSQLDLGQRHRAEAMVFDLLEPVDVVPMGARMPEEPRARAVAEALIRDPADNRTLDDFGHHIGVSYRTLARAFVTETGLGFGRWRTQIRLAAALPLLASGMPLSRIAIRVGYANASAFVAAFHREVGVSPGRYFSNQPR